MLELAGETMAEDIARVWPAGVQAGEGRWCNCQPLRRRQVTEALSGSTSNCPEMRAACATSSVHAAASSAKAGEGFAGFVQEAQPGRAPKRFGRW
jgi:hypothetical protein